MPPHVMTVTGPVEPDALGPTLMHEHVFIDLTKKFQYPQEASLQRFVHAKVDLAILHRLRRRPFSLCLDNAILSDEQTAIDELTDFAREGGSAVVDCTVLGLGQDPTAVRRVARATGLHIVQGTGVYVESTHPDWVADASSDELAELFIRDVTEGIAGTDIRAGLIGEIGTSGITKTTHTTFDLITKEEEKVLRAAGRASVATGAAVSVHLDPRGDGACRVLDVLADEGVAPERTIMCHMDARADLPYHLAVAERGVFVEYDHFGREYFAGNMVQPFTTKPGQPDKPYTSNSRRIELLCELLAAGYERQLLLSQDVCAKIDLTRFGGVGYAHIMRDLVPLFREAGVTQNQLHLMLVANPRRALAF